MTNNYPINRKVFKIGDSFTSYGLYGGPCTTYTVVDRTENTVTFEKVWMAEENWWDEDAAPCRAESTYPISCDEHGNERIQLWEYRGEVCWQMASSSALDADSDEAGRYLISYDCDGEDYDGEPCVYSSNEEFEGTKKELAAYIKELEDDGCRNVYADTVEAWDSVECWMIPKG